MTAQNMVDNVARQLSNLKVGDTTVPANEATLLRFLNLAKNQIATDTLTWLSGEIVTMTSSYEYTLASVPIQIIDIYDDKQNIRPRNSTDRLGYYQLSPQVIYVNNPEVDTDLQLNYYYTPADYILTDTLDVPPGMELAMEYFMKALAYDIYKSEKEQALSAKAMQDYEKYKNIYLSKTDNGNVDSIIKVNLIAQKGLV